MDPSAVSVLIVDDQAPFRRAAAAVVRVTGGFEVVGEAGSGKEAVDLAGALVPNLVLMDINMGGINGIEAAPRITAALPQVVVVLLHLPGRRPAGRRGDVRRRGLREQGGVRTSRPSAGVVPAQLRPPRQPMTGPGGRSRKAFTGVRSETVGR